MADGTDKRTCAILRKRLKRKRIRGRPLHKKTGKGEEEKEKVTVPFNLCLFNQLPSHLTFPPHFPPLS